MGRWASVCLVSYLFHWPRWIKLRIETALRWYATARSRDHNKNAVFTVCLQVLSEMLADKDFFFGAEPTLVRILEYISHLFFFFVCLELITCILFGYGYKDFPCPPIFCQFWTPISIFHLCSWLLSVVKSMQWAVPAFFEVLYSFVGDIVICNNFTAIQKLGFEIVIQTLTSMWSPGSTVAFEWADAGVVWKRKLRTYPLTPELYIHVTFKKVCPPLSP